MRPGAAWPERLRRSQSASVAGAIRAPAARSTSATIRVMSASAPSSATARCHWAWTKAATGIGTPSASAAAALHLALDALQRLFAPFIPFATEETWSWSHDGSIHSQPWPEQSGLGGDPAVLTAASTVLTAIRRAKTDAKASQKTPARSAVVTAPAELVSALRLASGPTVALGLTKWLLHTAAEHTLEAHLRDEAFALELSSRSEDFREGLRAFVDKRDPGFTGR